MCSEWRALDNACALKGGVLSKKNAIEKACAQKGVRLKRPDIDLHKLKKYGERGAQTC